MQTHLVNQKIPYGLQEHFFSLINTWVTLGSSRSEAEAADALRHLIKRCREVLSLWQILDDNEFYLVVERLSQVCALSFKIE